jgi:hypothetical protein
VLEQTRIISTGQLARYRIGEKLSTSVAEGAEVANRVVRSPTPLKTMPPSLR